MKSSHVADWGPDAPTPAQLKELFAQIESGRISKARLQALLRGDEFSPAASLDGTPYDLARAIMGRNFLGIEEAQQHYGVTFSDKQLVQLAEVPFTEATLQECKDTHILVAGFPLSINDVRRKVPHRTLCAQSWYQNQAFARKKVKVEWFLLRKDIVPNSTSETYQRQLTLLASNEENPLACQVVYAVALYFLATGERLFGNLFGNVYARCQDTTLNGPRVGVGCFDEDGLDAGGWWDADRNGRLGLASARKS